MKYMMINIALALILTACTAKPKAEAPATLPPLTATISSTSMLTRILETPVLPAPPATEILAAQLKRLGFNIRGWT